MQISTRVCLDCYHHVTTTATVITMLASPTYDVDIESHTKIVRACVEGRNNDKWVMRCLDSGACGRMDAQNTQSDRS